MQLPQETKNLEGFEVWDPVHHVPAHKKVSTAFVSILSSGAIGINRIAYKLFGEPPAVQVMFDPKLQRIGVKPAAPGSEHSYYIAGMNSVQIQCGRLFSYYVIPRPRESRRYTPKFIDGVLVIDL